MLGSSERKKMGSLIDSPQKNIYVRLCSSRLLVYFLSFYFPEKCLCSIQGG